MKMFGRAAIAEALKLRRTMALWLTFIVPLFLVGLQFLVYTQRGQAFVTRTSPWAAMRGSLNAWAVVLLPMFIAMQTALLGGLEHATKQWKHLFVLPAPRWAIYVAKFAAMLVLSLMASLILWAGVLAAGAALHLVFPSSPGGPIFARETLRLAVLAYLASWWVSAIQTWVALRWDSFTRTVMVGLLGMVTGLTAASSDWSHFYPWLLSFQVIRPRPEHLTEAVLLGMGAGLVTMIAGCWDMTRRDVL
jgi:lantibiotic transport system permease protein